MAHTPSGHWIGYCGALMRRRKNVCGQCLLARPPAPYQVQYPRCTSVSPTPSTRAGRREASDHRRGAAIMTDDAQGDAGLPTAFVQFRDLVRIHVKQILTLDKK